MSSSESDFSDVESDQKCGATSVMLGFPGKPIGHEVLSTNDNFIGGCPTWPGETPPSSDLYKCHSCGTELDLLAQMNCPLYNKWYDRVLYIFSCHMPSCRGAAGSIRCIRGIHKTQQIAERRQAEEADSDDASDPVAPPQVSIGDQLFGGSSPGSNPFASGGIDLTSTPSSYQINQGNRSHTKTKRRCKPELGTAVGRYPCKLLEVEEEYLTPDLDKVADIGEINEDVMDTLPDIQDSAPGGKSEMDEALAAVAADMTDPVFAKFVKIVDKNPQQVLRYEVGLKPLPFRGGDDVYQLLLNPEKIPDGRVPEVQLMPHLISQLETADMIADGMEWGTIIVATQPDDELPLLDANGVGFSEEWVGVQWETFQ